MLSEMDRYILARCKKDPQFAKDYAFYDQALNAALLIFRFRTKMHLTQGQLARKAHISRSTIARIEDGDMNPSVLLLSKIANSCHKKLRISIV